MCSQDASRDKHGNYVLEFVEKIIEKLGTDNVVQIVTDEQCEGL